MGEAAAEKDFYWKLFKSTFIISAFTIGGGFVIIPLLKAKFVDEYKWMDDKEALNLVAIAQSAPGVVAANAAISMGYKLGGIRGTIPQKNILIDHSFAGNFEAAYKEFKFDGGPEHE